MFRSQGFILEGFPRTPDEVGYLAESSLFPDAVIVFAVDDPDVVARRFPDRIERLPNVTSLSNYYTLLDIIILNNLKLDNILK